VAQQVGDRQFAPVRAQSGRNATVEAGHAWDALRIPEPHGSELYERLASDAADRLRLGPIVLSTRSGCTYWLIATGSPQESWPAGCRLLARHSWIALPGLGLSSSYARWLHLPAEQGRLTGAVWLAGALDVHRTAP
jgi:hypothetical protein